MDPQTSAQILMLNRQFYQTFALQFSATRQRIQPGVSRILDAYPGLQCATSRVLDLGCGNGELRRALATRSFAGQYTGVDLSAGLLAEARRHSPEAISTVFLEADLSQPDWITRLPHARYDFVLAFAALHHLPGSDLRLEVLQAVRSLLAAEGYFIHSQWQFLNSERLRRRIQPWEAAGVDAESVEPGDYLLDWRQGGQGLRYVHHFSEEELGELAARTGFKIVESFYSDGEGGRLGLYQTWMPA